MDPNPPPGLEVPPDMPIILRLMLQTRITEAWDDYEGNTMDPAEFWQFLIEGE